MRRKAHPEESGDALKDPWSPAQRELHISRYQYAAKVISEHSKGRNGNMIDIACGHGYGSYLLNNITGMSVHGGDLDENSVEYARENYTNKDVEFHSADITDIPFPSQHFDYVVSIETMEHLGLDKAREAASEFARILKPGGLLVVSSPNKVLTRVLYKIFGDNPYHRYEFTPFELRGILEKEGFILREKAGQFVTIPLTYRLANRRLLPLSYFRPSRRINVCIGMYFLLCMERCWV